MCLKDPATLFSLPTFVSTINIIIIMASKIRNGPLLKTSKAEMINKRNTNKKDKIKISLESLINKNFTQASLPLLSF